MLFILWDSVYFCDILMVYFSFFYFIELVFWCGFWVIYRGFLSFWIFIRELKSGLKWYCVVRDFGCRIVVFDWREWNNVWFELIGGLKILGLKKLGFYCVLFFKCKIYYVVRNLWYRCLVFSCILCVVIVKVILW